MTAADRAPVRVGVFGLLGSGNLGNDGSLEAVLGYLRADHPLAVVDALCGGPDAVTTRFGIPVSTPTQQPSRSQASRVYFSFRLGLSCPSSSARSPGSQQVCIEPVLVVWTVMISPSSSSMSARKRL